jgi:hypothetical protein
MTSDQTIQQTQNKKITQREAQADPKRKAKATATTEKVAAKLKSWNGVIITLFNNATKAMQKYQNELEVLVRKRTPRQNVQVKSFTYNYSFLSNAWGIFNQDIQAAIQSVVSNPAEDLEAPVDVWITEVAGKMGLGDQNIRNTQSLCAAIKNHFRGQKSTQTITAAQLTDYRTIVDSFYQDAKSLRAIPFAMMRNWDTVSKKLDQMLQQSTVSTTETNKTVANKVRKVSDLFEVYRQTLHVVATLFIERALAARAVLSEFYRVGKS